MCKSALLKNDHVAFSAQNVLSYFTECNSEIDDILGEYLRDHLDSDRYELEDITILSDNETFIQSALQNSVLTDKSIDVLMSGSSSVLFANFDIEGLDASRVKVAAQFGRIPVTAENILFIRENYPSCETTLAISDIDEYINIFRQDNNEIDFSLS